MYSRAELIILAKAYIDLTGIAVSTLSTRACGNDKTFSRLFEGLDCTARTVERASNWFDVNWPTGPWPAEVIPRRRVPVVGAMTAEIHRPR
jgi:hypothetical protein